MASVSLSCSATSLRAATVAREGHARRADRGQRYRGRVFSARPGASHRGEASTSTSSDDLDDLISAVASGARDLTRSEIDRLTSELNLTSLCDAACAVRAAGPDPGIVTFSPKVFVPLTFACRDRCGYCTFAKDPEAGSKIYMSLEQVIEVAERGRVAGATECLFTLGDRPEALYPAAKHELNEMGFESTVDYLAHCASAVLARTGLLPHCNAGVLTRTELAKLREVSVSQGLMLESTSDRLVDEPGAAHFNCESKRPATRIRTLDLAGELDVPFTSGILVGIGETREERLDALFAIRESDRKWRGHVQEVIVQNFRAKENTGMRDWPEPSLDELAWTAACARLIFGPVTQIQVPPNLTPEPDDAAGGGPVGDREGWRRLLRCGVSDWGGVSPGVTPDHVSPEAPWPHLSELARVTAEEGYSLVPRLAAQARYVTEGLERWIDARLAPYVRVLADSEGFARASGWCPASLAALEHSQLCEVDGGAKSDFDSHSQTQMDIDEAAVATLLRARGADFDAVCAAADEARAAQCGDVVTYVVNRNINYSNVCTLSCAFCAFSKGPAAEELRGKPYLLAMEEITRRTAEAWARGATEVCMQGGIHPDFTGDDYLAILAAAKAGAPGIHVHAFSPLEVSHGAQTLGLTHREFLKKLKDAGLGSLPGTAAEVLDDPVRAQLCPDKLDTDSWLELVATAHDAGVPTTSTMMFGHVDTDGPDAWARHLLRLRNAHVASVSRNGRGFTEYVPLPFVHFEAPAYRSGYARRGPTLRECVLAHAVGRLTLGAAGLTNVQASWVKMGPEMAGELLRAGCNDLGGVLMNESITRAAGARHGQEMSAATMEGIVAGVGGGRVARVRTTAYGDAPAGRREAAMRAGPLLEV
ncbi:hypothetical protein MICPUN_83126 [Micromonas commoda]|uniref:FO synthase n=1 Tax=Micromonas commoda (strain RCC299 / NOUM17 / CCMP2709) TaxID=296587 RepID=C1E7Q0_MICCC|nr:hypothetical protein MICPUN_83126 [Micromonas commoda]ACO64371.1 hypothetical protein MICPUN_83126 [Micromonas commoda]|eukprot:XP_002503113.1 hypothetical protein MICPUN_83126 [Micromonas commoda]